MVGSCKHADISVFSFHPVKTITTAEGGLVTTNNKKIDDKAKKLEITISLEEKILGLRHKKFVTKLQIK